MRMTIDTIIIIVIMIIRIILMVIMIILIITKTIITKNIYKSLMKNYLYV